MIESEVKHISTLSVNDLFLLKGKETWIGQKLILNICCFKQNGSERNQIMGERKEYSYIRKTQTKERRENNISIRQSRIECRN